MDRIPRAMGLVLEP
jgi:hypothetical protein